MRGKRWLSPVGLLLSLLIAAPAAAADLSVRSSTQYLWYTDPFSNDDQGDVVQYLKVDAAGLDSGKRLSVSGYGRLSRQFGADDKTLPGNSDDVLGRLYFLYADYSLPSDRGQVRMGRQYVSVGAGAGTVDGVNVELRNLGPVSASVFGGYNVAFAEISDRTRGGNYLAGGSLGGSFFEGNNVSVSYLRKYDQSDIVREMFGAHADQRILGKAKAYVDWRYDVLHQANAEFLAGVKAIPFSVPFVLTGEYYDSYPTFDADTIYTAFAVTRYKEIGARADYFLSSEWTLNAGYANSDYEGPTADQFTFGVTARPKRLEGLRVKASVVARNGYPGDMTGFQVSGEYSAKKATVGAGLDYDVIQRDSMTGDFSAKKYWAGGSYEVMKNMTARLRVEDTVTRLYSNEYQGRVSVDYRF